MSGSWSGGGEVDDEGVPGGALLGGEDARDGLRVESIGSQAVDSLCGKGHEAAGAE